MASVPPFRAALAAAALAALVGSGAGASAAQRVEPAKRAKLERAPVAARALRSFTPSPGEAAGATLRAGAAPDLKTFRFTPSGQVTQGKALTLGIRARPLVVPDSRRGAADVDGFDVGVAVAARGVALTGGATQIDTGLARREVVTMGLGYGRRDWTAQVKVGEERNDVRGASRLGAERRYSIELGGAYTLTRALSVGAGVRYRVAPEASADARARADDRSAYLGLGIAF